MDKDLRIPPIPKLGRGPGVVFVGEEDFLGPSDLLDELNVLFGHGRGVYEEKGAIGLQIKAVEVEFLFFVEDVPGVEIIGYFFHRTKGTLSPFKKTRLFPLPPSEGPQQNFDGKISQLPLPWAERDHQDGG